MKTQIATSSIVAACLSVLAPAQIEASLSAQQRDNTVADQKIENYRTDLLDLAFGAVSAMPLMPHVKNRSRAQERVITACFQLDQPERALRYVRQIENWRRGVGYADYALYCARQGRTDSVERFLALAEEAADSVMASGNPQAWRRDRVRTKIAQVYAVLGQPDRVAKYQAGVVDSEAGKVGAIVAERISAEDLATQLTYLDAIVKAGKFEHVRNAMATCIQLWMRFHGDAETRADIESRMKTGFAQLPVMMRVDLQVTMVDKAMDLGDRETALRHVREATVGLDSRPWQPEHEVTMRAKMAKARHRVGDVELARKEIGKAFATYEEGRRRIIDMYRGGVLRAIAETYHAMGERESALATYKMAAEAGVENPNSRPRADDLAETCCSMAVVGFRPDAELMARLVETRRALKAPW